MRSGFRAACSGVVVWRPRSDVPPVREHGQWNRAGDVDRGHLVRILVPELGRDQVAPVAAVREEAVVTEHLGHQLRPDVGGTPVVDAGHAVGRGEAEARERGQDTSKESLGSPPWAAGSVSGPTSSWKSQKHQGQPCERIRGFGFGPLPRAWMKWMGMPWISAR